MEAFGPVLRPPLCCSGAGTDARPFTLAAGIRSQSKAAMTSWGGRNLKVSRFWDNSHLQYYWYSNYSFPRCGGGKKKKTQKECSSSSGVLKNKKKSKLLKGLQRDLSLLSGRDPSYAYGYGIGLVDQVQAKMISEAAERLLVQLRQQKAQEKELKRMRKVEKAKFLDSQGVDCEASSAFSDSSDSSSSDSDSEVVDMSLHRLRMEAAQSYLPALPPLSLPLPISLNDDQIAPTFEGKGCCANGAMSSSVPPSPSPSLPTKRIEVCMGSKCKKAGAEALLREFGTRLRVEGAVLGCKCMGKCKDGPNVRVLDGPSSASTASTNSMCIGVNLEDVGSILSNLLVDDPKVGLLHATA